MLKVFIVDDDLLIRTNIKLMLDWENCGFTICGEASNGLEALETINKENPDIIIIDIRMPVMDGLQLTSEINKLKSDSKMIMLSSYDDYEYVRGALKNGAVDYLLKHNLNREALLDVLTRTKQLISSKKDDKVPSNDGIAGNLAAVREKFIIQLLTGYYESEDTVQQHIKALNMKIENRNTLVIIMAIDDYRAVTSEGKLKNISLMEAAVINITEEILNDSGNGVISHIANERFVILLSFENRRSAAAVDSFINSLLGRIAVCLKKFLSISISFGIGYMCERLADISVSYESAEKALLEKFYTGKSSILKTSVANVADSPLVGLDIESEKQLLSYVRSKDWDNMFKKLEDIFNRIKNEKLSLVNSQMIFNDLLNVISRICKENDISLSSLYTDKAAPHIQLGNLETIDEIKHWLIQLYNRMVVLLEPDKDKSNSEYVRKAIKLIKNRYSENISLQDISDEIKISSAYLSTLFKKEMGIGFSEFLCDLRLEKAKALLEGGQHQMKDIIRMCGFNNYAYFFNTFRKKTGVTPKEFLSRMQA